MLGRIWEAKYVSTEAERKQTRANTDSFHGYKSTLSDFLLFSGHPVDGTCHWNIIIGHFQRWHLGPIWSFVSDKPSNLSATSSCHRRSCTLFLPSFLSSVSFGLKWLHFKLHFRSTITVKCLKSERTRLSVHGRRKEHLQRLRISLVPHHGQEKQSMFSMHRTFYDFNIWDNMPNTAHVKNTVNLAWEDHFSAPVSCFRKSIWCKRAVTTRSDLTHGDCGP